MSTCLTTQSPINNYSAKYVYLKLHSEASVFLFKIRYALSFTCIPKRFLCVCRVNLLSFPYFTSLFFWYLVSLPIEGGGTKSFGVDRLNSLVDLFLSLFMCAGETGHERSGLV